MPDIDTDFCVERRDEVIAYVTEKYGQDHVAQIVTFGTMAARAAVRDAGRALAVPLGDVDRVAKLIPSGPGGLSIETGARADPRARQRRTTARRIVRQLLDTAKSIEGLARHASTHAAGVVISKDPLVDVAPLIKLGDDDINTQYDMNWVERIGLAQDGLPGPAQPHGHEATPSSRSSRIEHPRLRPHGASPRTTCAPSRCSSRGETTGVFQLESDGMRRVVTELQADEYARRHRRARRAVPAGPDGLDPAVHQRTSTAARSRRYLHPLLEPILEADPGRRVSARPGRPCATADGIRARASRTSVAGDVDSDAFDVRDGIGAAGPRR